MGLGVRLFKLMNQGHVWLYHTSRGRLGSMGGTVLLLTTTGARSGKPHTVPLRGFAHEDGWLVAGSAGGSPHHPAWYHNLARSPDVTVERDGVEYVMSARVTTGAERAGLWQQIVDTDRRFAGYEAKTEREIPVVVLETAD